MHVGFDLPVYYLAGALAGLLLAGCASTQDAIAGDPPPTAEVTEATPEAPAPTEEPSTPPAVATTTSGGAAFAERVQAGLDPASLPDGFSLVGTLDTPRDAQPAQLYGTSRYAAARADPKLDMGQVVTVRLVPTSPEARAAAPAPGDGITVQARDDLAPGAVQYTLPDIGDSSITVPAGDSYDVIVAANADSVDLLGPFVEAITR